MILKKCNILFFCISDKRREMANLCLLNINLCIAFCYGGWHSGGATRHLRMTAPTQKPVADFGDRVGKWYKRLRCIREKSIQCYVRYLMQAQYAIADPLLSCILLRWLTSNNNNNIHGRIRERMLSVSDR